MRPSAWSSRRSSSAGKRAANGARGLSISVPTDLKPSRRSVVRVSGVSRNASIGKRRQRRGFLARGQDSAGRGVKARQRPGRAGRSGDGKPRRQAEISFKPRGKIGDELLLAAEQMRGAFDVEEKTVGAVFLAPGRGGRRVARRPQRQPAQRGIVGGGIDGAHLQQNRFRPRVGQGSPSRNPAASAASFKAAMRRPPAPATARTNGRSGSTGLSARFFACAARKRRIGQRGSQTETMRDMIVLHYPFARPSVAAAFKLQMPSRARDTGRSGRARLPPCRRASALPRRSTSRFGAGRSRQERQAPIAGGEMQPLAGLQIELVDHAGDGGRRAPNATPPPWPTGFLCGAPSRPGSGGRDRDRGR